MILLFFLVQGICVCVCVYIYIYIYILTITWRNFVVSIATFYNNNIMTEK